MPIKRKSQIEEIVEVDMVKGETIKRRRRISPISRQQFRNNAKPLRVELTMVGSSIKKVVLVSVKEFKTGSLGWWRNQKSVVEVNGVECDVQLTVQAIIVGSKELSKEV